MSKYTYDPNGTAYHLKGGKHTCPSCGKHTLQLYLAAGTGEPINDQVGKCDRHYNCGYDYTPKAYYSDNPKELPPAKDSGRRMGLYEPPKPLVVIPKEFVMKSIIREAKNGQCSFIDILLQMFMPDDVQRVVSKYYLGRTKSGAVIFWQIDAKGLVHEGKAMKYDVHTGGRDKASWATGESFWIFSNLQSRGILPNGTTSAKCMFGEHLLRDANGDTTVYITESEKNAIYGAIIMPDATWLAVGSSQDIGKVWNARSILVKCRSVVFVPDTDALQDWRDHVQRFRLGNAKVSNLCAGHAGGWDLADYVRDIHINHPQQLIATPPQTKPVEVCMPGDTSLYSKIYNEMEQPQLPPDFFATKTGTPPF